MSDSQSVVLFLYVGLICGFDVLKRKRMLV